MREIKFRAWDIEEKKIRVVTDLNFFDEYMWTDETPAGNGVKLPIKDTPLMQYTGLKDKNGKEIYEGDIVQTHFDKTDQYEAYTEIGVVNITPHRTEIEDKKHGKYNGFYSHSEIIGNIYENPDLISNV